MILMETVDVRIDALISKMEVDGLSDYKNLETNIRKLFSDFSLPKASLLIQEVVFTYPMWVYNEVLAIVSYGIRQHIVDCKLFLENVSRYQEV